MGQVYVLNLTLRQIENALAAAEKDGIVSKTGERKNGEDVFTVTADIQKVLNLGPRVMRWLENKGHQYGFTVTQTFPGNEMKALEILAKHGIWEHPMHMIIDLYTV